MKHGIRTLEFIDWDVFLAERNKDVTFTLDFHIDAGFSLSLIHISLWKSGYYDYEIEIIDRLFEAGINPDLLSYDGDHVLSGMGYFGFPEIFMKHKDKIKSKDIHIRDIHLHHIDKMKQGIEILLDNDFQVRYPRYINIRDITTWDEEQAWYRTCLLYTSRCV